MWRILLWWMLLRQIVRRRLTQPPIVITRSGLILLVFVIVGYWIPGTGFTGKTLWDWMQLLIVPVCHAVGETRSISRWMPSQSVWRRSGSNAFATSSTIPTWPW